MRWPYRHLCMLYALCTMLSIAFKQYEPASLLTRAQSVVGHEHPALSPRRHCYNRRSLVPSVYTCACDKTACCKHYQCCLCRYHAFSTQSDAQCMSPATRQGGHQSHAPVVAADPYGMSWPATCLMRRGWYNIVSMCAVQLHSR